MNSYEIFIHNMTDDTEMNAVQQALYDAGVGDAANDDIGAYLRTDKPRSVFVVPSDLLKAVKVLNDLGYETDEDEPTDEE